MTTTTYHRIKALLMEQRRQISNSPKAAAQLLDELGIRDLLVQVSPKNNTIGKTVAPKTAHKKSVAK